MPDMTPPLPRDGVTQGSLQFGLVEVFNPNPHLADRPLLMGELGAGLMDMSGSMLVDGQHLPFSYWDGRFPWREEEHICFREFGKGPQTGLTGMSWPCRGSVLMVEMEGSAVRRWTWPRLVLPGGVGLNDDRYLRPVVYETPVEYPGLGCVVDTGHVSKEDLAQYQRAAHYDFPHPAIYVGYHVDVFLNLYQGPTDLLVYLWEGRACRFVGTHKAS